MNNAYTHVEGNNLMEEEEAKGLDATGHNMSDIKYNKAVDQHNLNGLVLLMPAELSLPLLIWTYNVFALNIELHGAKACGSMVMLVFTALSLTTISCVVLWARELRSLLFWPAVLVSASSTRRSGVLISVKAFKC